MCLTHVCIVVVVAAAAVYVCFGMKRIVFGLRSTTVKHFRFSEDCWPVMVVPRLADGYGHLAK